LLNNIRPAQKNKLKLEGEFPNKVFGRWHTIDSLIGLDTSSLVLDRFKNNQWWATQKDFLANLGNLRVKEKDKIHSAKRYVRRHVAEEKNISKYLVEIHKKFSIPVACIVFVLLGAPLGIRSRKGSIGFATVISSGFFLIYWVCLLGGETLADKLIIDPAIAMWSPNIILGIIGVILTYKVNTFNG